MPIYEVKAKIKDHWWGAYDDARGKMVAPSSVEAVKFSKSFWREQGAKYYKLISVSKVGE